ncbi:MAG: uroporphyrinogen-III synthase [Gammaproteobacteria bacterium]|nr:uroporphyrinogen-III synthase [Gammaproteobacteria bacterium]
MNEPAVLVTRPTGQSEALCTGLRAQGLQPVVCPLIEIEAFPQPNAQQRQCLLALKEYQHLVFVSVNAVRCGMRWIEDYWPQLPLDLNWYTVGDASARELARYGVTVQRPEIETNSEGLLALADLQDVKDQKLLIIKGEGGREKIRETLQQRGARVEELTTYRRHRPALADGELYAIIEKHHCQLLLLSSGESLHNMVSLLNAEELLQVQQLAVVAPGTRVAALARTSGFSQVITAASATDDDMLAAITDYLATGG